MQQQYQQFTVRDFVLDDAFRRWVFQPDEQSMTFWHTFMLKHPGQQVAIDEAASLLLHLGTTYHDLTDASQQRIQQVLMQAFDERNASATPVRPMVTRQGWLGQRLYRRVAASAAVVLLVTAGLIWFKFSPHQERVHTAFGETRTVQLPDGSTVVLNGNSTLTFASNWPSDKPREVWLDGEAFFNVAKKPHRRGHVKFVTHASGLDITVLGTQFNVQTRRGQTAVTLVEGRVQLSKPDMPSGQIVEMKPGQFASTQPNIQRVDIRTEKPQLHTSWVQHQFAFENTALGEIAQQLRDTYGLEIIFEDSTLANRRFTGNLTNQSIETLLTTLSITFDLAVRQDGKRVVLEHNP
ncbi:DUF4974 domain-containing protein [Spirosoma taeanense]|uniref:DUF4974 domain-containing protein n=1 Tax=Spirosoma taeanense TaxID=2735870 RepID=A0A6M5YAL1_9BACT|nr:FecR domain-containing protein [Spirosoma taeanense]QJW91009.1 DUF4974 domain-containing protein [Spirosoma taeanense]